MSPTERQRYVRRAYEAIRQADEARRERFQYLQDPEYLIGQRGTLTGSRIA